MLERNIAISIGDFLPELVCGPISRTTLALYAGASGDHVPLHIDIDAAKTAGFDDVFSHGMLSMAYLGRLISTWAGPANIRAWSVRFIAITPVHATVVCSGEVIELFSVDNEPRARLALSTTIQGGATTLVGEAVVAIPNMVETRISCKN